MICFNKKYFLWSILLFLVLVFIAMFVRDSFIRPYSGDFLVIIFLYCLVRSFLKVPVTYAILGVLLFAFAVEGAQYFELARLLGWEQNMMASVVMGNHFDWLDMLLYTLGALGIFIVEHYKKIFR